MENTILFRGICRIFLILTTKIRKMSTCNKGVTVGLGNTRILIALPKNLPRHRLGDNTNSSPHVLSTIVNQCLAKPISIYEPAYVLLCTACMVYSVTCYGLGLDTHFLELSPTNITKVKGVY